MRLEEGERSRHGPNVARLDRRWHPPLGGHCQRERPRDEEPARATNSIHIVFAGSCDGTRALRVRRPADSAAFAAHAEGTGRVRIARAFRGRWPALRVLADTATGAVACLGA